ncbi:hypothetical protein [Nocardia concava]|uniref:hypothetical protein n=1 Tax=Nocardia concava TaxID=257281 RepID=UPI0002F24791|nr:hypothetical protein [Nocardia concava]
MSDGNQWSVQSIIERVEAERRKGGSGRHARRYPAAHRRQQRRVWRYGLALLEVALFGDGVLRWAGRHAAR